MGISLTAGMRANLVNLQQTSKLMEQTQVRLNTGKKVNSALDNPMSYFTARSHMSRADDLANLKDGMSEAIQTITAANDGINSMIALIEEAKAKAESAKSSETGGTGYDTVTVTLEGVAEADTITINGELYTCTGADVTAGANEFNVGTGDYADEITALHLAEAVKDDDDDGITAEVSGTTLNFMDDDASLDSDTISSSDSTVFTDVTVVPASSQKAALAAQYETLITQIAELRDDAMYKGVNLMDDDDSLTVKFEGDHELVVNGFDGDITTGLKMATAATLDWASDDDIDGDIALMDDAISYLESKASSLASSLSIVSTRQDFTTSMINNLTTGADNLTLADMNEEGANMLMLQTQQSLGSTSLSLAAQAAQSVLRLF